MATSPFINRIVNEEQTVRIEFGDGRGVWLGHLAPITRSGLKDAELIRKLTRWRNISRRYFFTQARVTCEMTRNWLENAVLMDGGRLLFVVFSNHNPVGTLGIKLLTERLVELGNLVRGSRGGGAQLMYHAEWALINWTFNNLEIDMIFGIALADNLMCLNLQKSLGFKDTQVIPLRKIQVDGAVELQPAEAGSEAPNGLYAHRMELTRSKFMHLLGPNSRPPNSPNGRAEPGPLSSAFWNGANSRCE